MSELTILILISSIVVLVSSKDPLDGTRLAAVQAYPHPELQANLALYAPVAANASHSGAELVVWPEGSNGWIFLTSNGSFDRSAYAKFGEQLPAVGSKASTGGVQMKAIAQAAQQSRI